MEEIGTRRGRGEVRKEGGGIKKGGTSGGKPQTRDLRDSKERRGGKTIAALQHLITTGHFKKGEFPTKSQDHYGRKKRSTRKNIQDNPHL